MNLVISPRLVALALAALVALAWFRVAQVQSPVAVPSPPQHGHTWTSAIEDARRDVVATYHGLRAEILRQEATYTRMWADLQHLQETLRKSPG